MADEQEIRTKIDKTKAEYEAAWSNARAQVEADHRSGTVFNPNLFLSIPKLLGDLKNLYADLGEALHSTASDAAPVVIGLPFSASQVHMSTANWPTASENSNENSDAQ